MHVLVFALFWKCEHHECTDYIDIYGNNNILIIYVPISIKLFKWTFVWAEVIVSAYYCTLFRSLKDDICKI